MKYITLKNTHYATAGEITLSIYGVDKVEATEENLNLFEKLIKGGYVVVKEEEDILKDKAEGNFLFNIKHKEELIKTELLPDEEIPEKEELQGDILDNIPLKTEEVLNYEDLTKKEIIEILKEKNIEFNPASSKKDLISLL